MKRLIHMSGYRVRKIVKAYNYFPPLYLIKHLLWAAGIRKISIPNVNLFPVPLNWETSLPSPRRSNQMGLCHPGVILGSRAEEKRLPSCPVEFWHLVDKVVTGVWSSRYPCMRKLYIKIYSVPNIFRIAFLLLILGLSIFLSYLGKGWSMAPRRSWNMKGLSLIANRPIRRRSAIKVFPEKESMKRKEIRLSFDMKVHEIDTIIIFSKRPCEFRNEVGTVETLVPGFGSSAIRIRRG